MIADYSFFVLLFVIATSLSPTDATRVELQNVRHPEQSITWARGGDGRWAATVNQRELGHFERAGGEVVHHTGQGAPDRFRIDSLVTPAQLGRAANALTLRGQFEGTVLRVERADGRVALHDPSGELLVTRLRLHHRR